MLAIMLLDLDPCTQRIEAAVEIEPFALSEDPARAAVAGLEPAQFAELLRNETTRWQKLITDLKITLD